MKTSSKELKIKLSDLDKTVIMLKAISHPKRLFIVSCLSNGERLSVREIQELVGLPQPVVSHHLTILKNAGVIVCKSKGKTKLHFIMNNPKSKYIRI
ncbi:MAG: transcriptional regulator [Bacteroidetes bacterium]|nr:transcriptional regulator [Bacteroidota bacterium]